MSRSPQDLISEVSHVFKPWGHEIIFAHSAGQFVGKVLRISAGQALSLQYHHHKDEVIALAEGEVLLTLGTGRDDLTTTPLRVGQSVRIPAGTWHQLTARTNAVLWEVSTAAQDWQTDVVRVDDRYGRMGTTAP